MTPSFKFLRRVRIHGGECGAVARALHHEAQKVALIQNEQSLISDEKALLRQADLGKSSGSTFIERKQMSTKKTLKRLALVAVSALGLGMISVVPASAATTLTSISVGTIPASRVGVVTTIPITVNWSSTAASDTVTIAAKVTSAPTQGGLGNAASVLASSTATAAFTDSTVRVYFGDSAGAITASTDYNGTAAGATVAASAAGVAAASGALAEPSSSNTGSLTGASDLYTVSASTETSTTFYLSVKPDVAGTYTLLVSASTTSGNAAYVAGDLNSSFSFTTAGAPTTVTMTNVGGTTNYTGLYGALVKVTLKDSAGNAATLAGDEGISISASSGYIAEATLSAGQFTSAQPSASTAVALSASDMVNGVGFINVKGTTSTGSTQVLTATGTGTLATNVTSTLSVTTAKAATIAETDWVVPASAATVTTGIYSAGAAAANVPTTATSVSLELGFTATTAASTGFTTIKDVSGAVSGAPGTSNALWFDKSFSAALSTSTSAVVAITLARAIGVGNFVFTDETLTSGDYDHDYTVTGAASALTNGTLTPDTDALRMATGGTATFGATVKDQYGLAKANASVTVTVSGRNSAKASQTIVTDANGRISYSFTDTGTSGTADTITMNATGAATDDISITYGTATAGSVLVTTPNTLSTGVEEYPKDPEDISAGDGADLNLYTVTALVKDADGNVMSSMPVTWTISGTGCAILSTTASGYTAAAGTDSASVYGWLTGTCTVTATSGGKSDDAVVHFAQETPTEARSISATVSGNVITATVKDRFGNTIENVPVKVTRTSGTGYFGSATTATANTDASGNVSFVVTGGAASVKVAFETAIYGQSDALAGLIDGTTATNVFTAYTAGTSLEAEEGVGSTFSAAGVNSVTVEVTADDASVSAANAASDAAAEAIDAANAATDAANLAAEAADAATVAAEEARDAADAATAAVEELATQVATLMAALKAQITTLANTVAKIAKKVKA